MRQAGHTVKIFFFDATDEVLIRRFSETRRRHPALEGASVPEGIRFERDQLAGLRRIATAIIDTSEMNVHRLKEVVISSIKGSEAALEMQVNLQSFGFRYGLPLESDLVMDVRFLPNPYFVPALRPFSGLDQGVRDFVLGQKETVVFLERFRDILEFLLPGLPPGGEIVPLGLHRLHRRQAPLGRHRRGAVPVFQAEKHQHQNHPQGHREGAGMIGLLLVAHAGVAAELLAAAEMIVGKLELAEAVGIETGRLRRHGDGIHQGGGAPRVSGDGAIIMTDMFGGTPSNMSLSFLEEGRVEVLTGVNLPMLIRFTQEREPLQRGRARPEAQGERQGRDLRRRRLPEE